MTPPDQVTGQVTGQVTSQVTGPAEGRTGRRYGLPWRGAQVAATAEAAGVSAFCSGEFVDHEAYSTLAEMALCTERALVGPGIAYAFARTPYAHAAAVRGAWRHAPGRVFLGLGSGAYKINRDWFGADASRPIQVHTPQAGFSQRPGLNSAEEHRDHLGQLAEAGADGFVLRPPGDSLDHAVEALRHYAEDFLK